MRRATAVALALVFALIPMAAAACLLNAAWTWWRNGEKVLATVTWASSDHDDGDTFAEVDYDGIQATVKLNGVHKVEDVVEVYFDPANPDRLNSKSDILDLLVGGLFLLVVGICVPIAVAVNCPSQSKPHDTKC